MLLPPSALHKLADLASFDDAENGASPMLFRIHSLAGPATPSNPPSPSSAAAISKVTHCGVLEFVADEGRIYAPEWMLKSLGVKGGDIVRLELCKLPKGSFVKLQPQSTDFLDISDPRAVLERSLRLFSALTTGDIFTLSYLDKEHSFAVLEVQPAEDGAARGGICIHETDLNVDFAPPVGYVEPDYAQHKKGAAAANTKNISASVTKLVEENAKNAKNQSAFVAFGGSGNRLIGSGRAASSSSESLRSSSRESTHSAAAKSSQPPPNAADPAKTGVRLPASKLFIPRSSTAASASSSESKAGAAPNSSSPSAKDPKAKNAPSFKAFAGAPNSFK